MTLRPATPVDPPQAAQTPADPGEAAVETIGAAVDQAREDVRSARERALDAAQSDEERAAVNARFDGINEQVGEFANRIEAAINSGNERMAGTFTQFLDRLDERMNAGQGTTVSDDDEIISVEEVAGDIADPVVGAAAAAGDAIEDAADEAPKRVHGLFHSWWGG